ncbi:MAG: PilT/PilU family type 4a pilus ATPase [Oscillospiraceae bacterium]|nr:PilT/PilU family type 4a pilus ATPase [Oscillospiraceae bacterium]
MEIFDILSRAVRENASDVFIIAGLPLTFKQEGRQIRLTEFGVLPPQQTSALIMEIYRHANRAPAPQDRAPTDDDFSFSMAGVGRFRINVFHQRGSLAAVVRVIRFTLPSAEKLGIPVGVIDTANFKKGVVLITGPAGSGKTTTLACILDTINHHRSGHIITLEDPVEYIHRHDHCIVSQREIFTDCPGFLPALRSALRESPDVILLGEMRDCETIEVAMTAAETGQLLFSSLHTTGAANTVDRIIDVFPASQQAQIRLQLSTVLQAVVSQQLVPSVQGTLVPAFEIMYVNMAIRNMIRESKTFQIDAAIQAGAAAGMQSMDASLLHLYRQGVISAETVLTYCINQDLTRKKMELPGFAAPQIGQ